MARLNVVLPPREIKKRMARLATASLARAKAALDGSVEALKEANFYSSANLAVTAVMQAAAAWRSDPKRAILMIATARRIVHKSLQGMAVGEPVQGIVEMR